MDEVAPSPDTAAAIAWTLVSKPNSCASAARSTTPSQREVSNITASATDLHTATCRAAAAGSTDCSTSFTVDRNGVICAAVGTLGPMPEKSPFTGSFNIEAVAERKRCFNVSREDSRRRRAAADEPMRPSGRRAGFVAATEAGETTSTDDEADVNVDVDVDVDDDNDGDDDDDDDDDDAEWVGMEVATVARVGPSPAVTTNVAITSSAGRVADVSGSDKGYPSGAKVGVEEPRGGTPTATDRARRAEMAYASRRKKRSWKRVVAEGYSRARERRSWREEGERELMGGSKSVLNSLRIESDASTNAVRRSMRDGNDEDAAVDDVEEDDLEVEEEEEEEEEEEDEEMAAAVVDVTGMGVDAYKSSRENTRRPVRSTAPIGTSTSDCCEDGNDDDDDADDDDDEVSLAFLVVLSLSDRVTTTAPVWLFLAPLVSPASLDKVFDVEDVNEDDDDDAAAAAAAAAAVARARI